MKLSYYLLAAFTLCGVTLTAQESLGPSEYGTIESYRSVPSIAEQEANGTLILADQTPKEGRPKLQHGNQVVPGKGMPKGDDPLRGTQLTAPQRGSQGVIDSWLADISQATPSDPTGAAGPNHYIGAWNTAFRIFDKEGTPLTAELSLATLFGNTIGDPIVFYDAQADRLVITQFDNTPNGFNVAVCQGSDPVNDGWHVYSTGFNTGAFPDYTKFAVFGDVYMVTANISSSNRVFAVERNQMLNGDPAQFVAFQLPGIRTFGFYSPHAFHTTDDQLAPAGTPVPIAYMQDDAWSGVDDDHIKIWNATVDWDDIGNSSISAAQELTVADFTGVFDGGSFSNRPQGGGVDIDILQSTMMNQVQYRRFNGYNSVLMNFVVDVLAGSAEKAAVRWYELRQTNDGDPWTIYQEGTFEAPDGKDAYSASMAMNGNGDIGMGYYTSSTTDRIAMNYTGRFATDPLNVMTVAPTELRVSTAANPSNRLADYVHTTVDPADDETFYYIAETFEPSRRNWVYHFDIGIPAGVDDVGIANAELNVISLPGNKFDISLVTDFDGVATISVIDIQGRTVAFNNIDKEGDRYKYSLDMSYASSGMYIIQMGSQEMNSYKTAKILVK
jgi:hypothetical protein